MTWHVDDLKSSHVDSEVNDEFLSWLEMKYAADGVGRVKVTRGQCHDYLGINLVFLGEGKLKIGMIDYIKKMCKEFPEELDGNTKYPWTEKLFLIDKKSQDLSKENSNYFHTHTR